MDCAGDLRVGRRKPYQSIRRLRVWNDRPRGTGPSGTFIGHLIYQYKVLAGVFPFADSPPTTVAVDVLSGKRPERPSHPSLTDELWNLIQRCWEQDPQRRPGISDVARHLKSIVRQNRGDYFHGIPAEGKYEYSIGSNGSETSLQSMKFRELDEPLGARKTTSGPCGLFRGATFRKPNRSKLSTEDSCNRPGIPSEKVRRTYRKILLDLIIVKPADIFLRFDVVAFVRIFFHSLPYGLDLC